METCAAHSRHSRIYWGNLEHSAQTRRKLGEQYWGFSQKAGGTVDVSSAAPHYNLLTLNSFSTPPTFHIFLVIRQQSMLLCVVWAHCFSSLTASILLFSPTEKLLLFLPSKINMGLDSLLPPGEHKRNTHGAAGVPRTYIRFPHVDTTRFLWRWK